MNRFKAIASSLESGKSMLTPFNDGAKIDVMIVIQLSRMGIVKVRPQLLMHTTFPLSAPVETPARASEAELRRGRRQDGLPAKFPLWPGTVAHGPAASAPTTAAPRLPESENVAEHCSS